MNMQFLLDVNNSTTDERRNALTNQYTILHIYLYQ